MSEAARDKHVQWCKDQALAYLDRGDIQSAITSMLADMGRRADTKVNPYLALLGIMAAARGDEIEARRFIVGFR